MSGQHFAHLGREICVRAAGLGLTLGLLMAPFAGGGAQARHRQDAPPPPLVLEALPARAPLQHVRFCQRYPSDCKSNPAEIDRIELNAGNAALLKSVNHDINATIVSTVKEP
jgi:predicted transglutaminase-like cysteine proteinase